MKVKEFKNKAQKSGMIQRIVKEYRYTLELFDRASGTVVNYDVEATGIKTVKAAVAVAYPNVVILSIVKNEVVRAVGYLISEEAFFANAEKYELEDC